MHVIAISVSAQTSTNTDLKNTKWQGRIEKPQSMDIILEFRKDSLVATADGSELEVMFFSQSKDTLRLRKLNGQSPCDDTAEGLYRLEWANNGEKLMLHIIGDDCYARAVSITSAVAYLRVKN